VKILGFLLLVSGWIIAAGAVTLLASSAPRIVFLLAGLGVETIGLVLFARSHPLLRGESD
jgi:hypothetical protein